VPIASEVHCPITGPPERATRIVWPSESRSIGSAQKENAPELHPGNATAGAALRLPEAIERWRPTPIRIPDTEYEGNEAAKFAAINLATASRQIYSGGVALPAKATTLHSRHFGW
jgi:hypothetical protein